MLSIARVKEKADKRMDLYSIIPAIRFHDINACLWSYVGHGCGLLKKNILQLLQLHKEDVPNLGACAAQVSA